MNDTLVDVRTPLAASRNARIELGRDGTLHILVGPVTLHVERALCEELAATLAVAMIRLHERTSGVRSPALRLVARGREPTH